MAFRGAERSLLIGVLVAASASIAVRVRYPVHRQPGNEFVQLLRHDSSIPGHELIQFRVGLDSGAMTPRHKHPGDEIIRVTEGAVEYRLDGSPPLTVREGESFLIPAGVIHAVANVGTGSASQLTTYVADKGTPLFVFMK
jgi:quercetin dioxygenase-like cupin family protein